jgi:hypothetical protein
MTPMTPDEATEYIKKCYRRVPECSCALAAVQKAGSHSWRLSLTDVAAEAMGLDQVQARAIMHGFDVVKLGPPWGCFSDAAHAAPEWNQVGRHLGHWYLGGML